MTWFSIPVGDRLEVNDPMTMLVTITHPVHDPDMWADRYVPRCEHCQRRVAHLGELPYHHCRWCMAIPAIAERAKGAHVMAP